ncbi:MAG TPA: SRPBCC domain-containing protein [Burkholderiales bacterium]|nr:SRPBCC domain-containing protein [Burkholderiales bacterium]
MHQREATFAVDAAPEAVWRFIRDFESLCTCVPGVERIQRIDDRTAELTVKEKVGIVPLIVDLTARIEAEDPPRSLHAVAKAEHLTMEIDVALQPRESGTELRSLFKVAGEGPLKPVVDRLFERRATERTAQFAECLAQRFSADASARAAAHANAESPPLPERPGRIRQWLARLRAWIRGTFPPLGK